jgi:hypothetical protein
MLLRVISSIKIRFRYQFSGVYGAIFLKKIAGEKSLDSVP